MAKRIKQYLDYIEEILKREDLDFTDEQRKHLIQIKFFMHERLIHLVVTFLFAILTVAGCMAFVIYEKISLLVLALAFMVLLVPYIKNYYLLENSVQKMYEQYDRMLAKTDPEHFQVK